jgi:hypothetical protein
MLGSSSMLGDTPAPVYRESMRIKHSENVDLRTVLVEWAIHEWQGRYQQEPTEDRYALATLLHKRCVMVASLLDAAPIQIRRVDLDRSDIDGLCALNGDLRAHAIGLRDDEWVKHLRATRQFDGAIGSCGGNQPAFFFDGLHRLAAWVLEEDVPSVRATMIFTQNRSAMGPL